MPLHPVRAGMVELPDEYRWSSYPCNAIGKVSDLITPHPEYFSLGATDAERQQAYRELFRHHLDNAKLDEIRSSVSKGLAFGDERFKVQIEENHKRRVTALKVGRKPR